MSRCKRKIGKLLYFYYFNFFFFCTLQFSKQNKNILLLIFKNKANKMRIFFSHIKILIITSNVRRKLRFFCVGRKNADFSRIGKKVIFLRNVLRADDLASNSLIFIFDYSASIKCSTFATFS